MEHFKKHLLLYTLIPLILLLIGASWYRFMYARDYTISYEGFCDPYTSSCFEYCEDDECLEPFHYTWVERNAAIVFEMCGELVLDCEGVDVCNDGEVGCSVSYCEPESGECENLTEEDMSLEEFSEQNI